LNEEDLALIRRLASQLGQLIHGTPSELPDLQRRDELGKGCGRQRARRLRAEERDVVDRDEVRIRHAGEDVANRLRRCHIDRDLGLCRCHRRCCQSRAGESAGEQQREKCRGGAQQRPRAPHVDPPDARVN
jgi:hypothetical protein